MTARPTTAQTILDRAEELFEQKGYAAVSIREICAACGVTKPTLYYYFKDKEALFVATLLRRLADMHTYLQAQYPAEPLSTRLMRFAVQLFQRVRTNVDVMMRDMENITQQEHHIELGRAFCRELHDPLLAAMKAGIADGQLQIGNAAIYTKVYLSLVNAFIEPAPQARSFQAVQSPTQNWDAQQRAEWLVSVLFDGIGTEGVIE